MASSSSLRLGLMVLALLTLASSAGCSPPCTQREIAAARYEPASGDDWQVSSPEARGLDPALVGKLYCEAARMDRLYSLLLVKQGHLVAEGYFNEGTASQKALLQSATKSYVSALVGIALERGCLQSVDQPMMAFFPDLAGQVRDPRKKQITLQHLLQMRSGYPWEEDDAALWERFLQGNWLPLIASTPLASDPGTEHHYSNLTSYILSVVVARACDTDLPTFSREHLFTPLGTADANVWGYPDTPREDDFGYTYPALRSTARSVAKLGQLYLDDGKYQGNQVIPASWVRASLTPYSEGAWPHSSLGSFEDIGYGYQWWTGRAGKHRVQFAWGHGGQLVVLLDELDMVIVTTADPFFRQHDGESWRHEAATFELVSELIEALPGG